LWAESNRRHEDFQSANTEAQTGERLPTWEKSAFMDERFRLIFASNQFNHGRSL
jgi:hypothetical protein